MKTHRIILPAEWHALALRGVSRLLLPMDLTKHGFDSSQPSPKATWCQLEEPHGWAWWGPKHHDGRALRYQQGVECPYRAGDRLALLEPWDSYEKEWFVYKEGYPEGDRYFWKPASRMPLAACRCFYRVASVEPVRISEIGEEHARECGCESCTPADEVRARWASERGRSREDWAWSVRVENLTKRERENNEPRTSLRRD